MKKNILVILFCLNLFNKSIAQHCPFDNLYILVVRMTADDTKKTIPNLQITALDTLNNPVEIDKKRITFWENPKSLKPNTKSNDIRKYLYFNFAKDAYILITNKNNTPLIKKIEIKDIDGSSNGGTFKTKIASIAQEKFFPLCSWSPANQNFTSFPKNYKPNPIEISLQNDTISTTKLHDDEKILYEKILGNNQVSVFTGKKDNKETTDNTQTNSLLIKSIDSLSIRYQIEHYVNWHPQKKKTGIAKLDVSSVKTNQWEIKDNKGRKRSAFRFLEQKGKCKTEILISKEKQYPQSICIVNKICNNQSKPITVQMRYK